MPVLKKIPFFSNTKDNTHCFQACLKMILKFLYPEKSFSFKKLDEISQKPKNKWTWPYTALINLKKMGLVVKYYSTFDCKKFAKEGLDYLKKKFPKDFKTILEKTGDIKKEMRNAEKLIKSGIFSYQKTSLKSVKRKFNQNYLVIFHINTRILHKKKGYSGHFVVLVGFDKNYLFIHDPGLPPYPERKVPKSLFLKAWQNYSVILIKKPK